jgi:hypothetical protein
MATKVSDGSYMARGISMEPIKAEGTGTKGIAVEFVILDEGPFKDCLVPWVGWLSDGTKVRTAESLALCGFDGTDPKTIGKDIVMIVVEEETYIKDKGLPTEKTYKNTKVKWVNDPSRGRTQFTPLDPAEKQEAMAGLRGLVLDQKKQLAETRAKAAAGQPAGSGSSFAFGANVPAGGGPAPAGAAEPNKKSMF